MLSNFIPILGNFTLAFYAKSLIVGSTIQRFILFIVSEIISFWQEQVPPDSELTQFSESNRGKLLNSR